MQKETEELIETFFDKVNAAIKTGKSCRDAIDGAAVEVGGFLPSVVSRAVSKYQEATHPQMPLSQQKDVDTLAFASMGKLWHNETYNNASEPSVEDIMAQAIYLILKYTKQTEAHEWIEILMQANSAAAGDKEARKAAIVAMLV